MTWAGLGRIFFGFAILAGIAHLYALANCLWHVIGGAALGLAIGLPIAIKLIPRTRVFGRYSLGFIGWSSVCAFGLAALMFSFRRKANLPRASIRKQFPVELGGNREIRFRHGPGEVFPALWLVGR